MEELYDSCEECSAESGSIASDIAEEQYLDDSPKAAASSSNPLGYTTLSPADLQSVQDKALKDVAIVLACPKGVARTLLIYFRWNPEKLFGKTVYAPSALLDPP